MSPWAQIVAGWTGRPVGTRGTMPGPLSPAARTTDVVRVPAPYPSPAPAIAAAPEATLRSLLNPPLVALGLAVLFLLALLVAVLIGSDGDTESADEVGAAVPKHAEVAADARTE